MEKYDFCIINAYHGDEKSESLARKLNQRGTSVCIITPNFYEYKTLLNKKLSTIFINSFFPKNFTKDETQHIKKRYNLFSLRNFIYNEKKYYEMNFDYLSKKAITYFCAFEEILKKYKFGVFLQNQGGEIIRRVAFKVAKFYNIPTIYLGETLISGYSTLYKDEFKTLIKPLNSTNNISDSFFIHLIEKNKKNKPVIKYSKRKYPGGKVFSMKNLDKFITYLNSKSLDIIKMSLKYKYRTFIECEIKNFFASTLFEKTTQKENYFYLPLNVPVESELFIRNPSFSNQLSFVKILSKNLPYGYKLYVKPHPGREGHLSIKVYKELKKIRKVRLIHPNINSYDLIEKSKAVIIVSSTVGYESMIMQKPIVVFGNWPYTCMGKFTKVSDFTKISYFLNKAVEISISQKDSVFFLRNISKNSFKGSIYGNEKDINNLADSLLALYHSNSFVYENL